MDGMPWDSMAVSRSGANDGPRGIREMTSQFLSYNATWDFDLFDALTLVDCGDCHVVVGNAGKMFERSEADIGEILAAGAVPVVLGGDHSITIPAVRAMRWARQESRTSADRYPSGYCGRCRRRDAQQLLPDKQGRGRWL